MVTIITHTNTGVLTIMKMNKYITTFVMFLLNACALAPGMYLDEANFTNGQKVYLKDSDRKYIDIEPINSELLASDDLDLLPNALPTNLVEYIPAEYLIGSGDTIAVSVWGPEELFPRNLSARGNPLVERVVRSDGTIFYPYVGEVKVEGKSREEVRRIISDALNLSFKDAQVDISVVEYNSQKIILSGAFVKPGNIKLNEVPITLSEAISLGGSPDDDADLTKIKLIRDGKTDLIDYDYYARNTSLVHEIFVKNNDVIHIPFDDEQKVYVVGEVVKQSTIDLKRRSISLSDAIARAGGLSNQTADGSEVYVIRKADDLSEARIFQINLKNPAALILAAEFQLKEQDIVFVGPANIARWNRVIAQFFPFTTFLNAVDNISSSN